MMSSAPSPAVSFVSPTARGDAARKAFTLMEILVALAILGLLVGLAVTKLGGIFSGAQVTTTKYFVNDSMKTALTTYKIQVGDYPSTDEGLQALLVAPADKADRWHGPYVEGSSIPLDPWGHAYKYAYPGTHNKDGYDIWSTGPDGIDGTADDIGNW
jgi:general secretion pathway protein G